MAFDEKLGEQTRKALSRRRGITEKKMFGGLAFLLHGNMCCGVIGKKLVIRVGPDRYEKDLKKTGIKPMDFTGKPLRGYIYVLSAGRKTPTAFKKWIEAGLEFARSLPKK